MAQLDGRSAVFNLKSSAGGSKMIRFIALVVLCTALGGCWSTIINSYSGDPTLKGNSVLVDSPSNVPVQPDGGGGGN